MTYVGISLLFDKLLRFSPDPNYSFYERDIFDMIHDYHNVRLPHAIAIQEGKRWRYQTNDNFNDV